MTPTQVCLKRLRPADCWRTRSTYATGPRRPYANTSADLGDAGHRWLTAIGPIDDKRVLMNIDVASGGIFDSATQIQHTEPPGADGTLTVTFTDCNSATVDYNLTSINRQGTVPIQRVAKDNIRLCEVLTGVIKPTQ